MRVFVEGFPIIIKKGSNQNEFLASEVGYRESRKERQDREGDSENRRG